ncbi:phage anti-repressor protein [Cricetibacter osteomyelitidis]|uniref:Phage anti-repressor protein n=1 Tax=Cricetibacter osteomyelitidis TaxID=1521931 RepID=A0A4R2T3B9_9PAST|nr:antA/AntB antirepressor family protein [Cricetibacter osteomyelitidis]TCP95334.1 phage anti-repressor protein [Cricetibacter osteomyelitidis]
MNTNITETTSSTGGLFPLVGGVNNLLPVQEKHLNGVKSYHINARDLHHFLESKRDFSNWIKDRIEKYGFKVKADYYIVQTLSSTKLATSNVQQSAKARKQKQIDYIITLSMAKELAMVERNEQGKLARQYFIKCENRLAEIAPKETALLRYEWAELRQSSKTPFKAMNNALERMRHRQGKQTKAHHYTNEANLINSLVLGMSAKQWRTAHQIAPQTDLRQTLTAEQLAMTEYLERANEILLDSDISDYGERRAKLTAMLNNRFLTAH